MTTNWLDSSFDITNQSNKDKLLSNINAILPIDPSINTSANDINWWGAQYVDSPNDTNTNVKWVRIGIAFNGNWNIAIQNSNPLAFISSYRSVNYLLIYSPTGIVK